MKRNTWSTLRIVAVQLLTGQIPTGRSGAAPKTSPAAFRVIPSLIGFSLSAALAAAPGAFPAPSDVYDHDLYHPVVARSVESAQVTPNGGRTPFPNPTMIASGCVTGATLGSLTAGLPITSLSIYGWIGGFATMMYRSMLGCFYGSIAGTVASAARSIVEGVLGPWPVPAQEIGSNGLLRRPSPAKPGDQVAIQRT
ncbi:hypothetical protein CCP2SC5_570009 [Azospirillaceae bacterium]